MGMPRMELQISIADYIIRSPVDKVNANKLSMLSVSDIVTVRFVRENVMYEQGVSCNAAGRSSASHGHFEID